MTFPRLIIAVALAIAAMPACAAPALGPVPGALGNIFVEGEPVAIPLRAAGENRRWSVKDFFGTEIASGVVGASNPTAILAPPVHSPGYFTLDIAAGQGQQPATRTAFAIVPRRPDSGSASSPFGVMTHFAKGWSTDIIPLIEKAGIRHIRDEQPWRLVERQPAQYAFPPRLSGFMSELVAHRIDPLILLAFSNPLYDSDQTPFSDAGRAGYAAYARAVVQHYAPNLAAVEVWNEYNGSFCTGPCRKDRPRYYGSMLKETYKSLKEASPSLTVLGGAAVPIPLDYFRQIFDQGALDAMDAIVIHPYRRQPEGVEQQIEALRQLMSRYGKPKPIWATEFSDLPDMRKSRDDMARYLVRMSTLLLSARVERVYWYLMRDYQEFTGLGLVRDETDPLGRYAPTPAYVAYAVLIHELDGANFVRQEPSAAQARVYLFADHGREIRVLWSADSNTRYELASARPMRRITMMGDETLLTPRDGKIALTLDQNPVYLVSGVR